MRRLTFFAILVLIIIGFWRFSLPPAGPSREVPADARTAPDEEILRSRPDLSASQAAVLLLGEDQRAFAASRILEAAGLSFTVTRDKKAALRHRLVFIPLDDHTLRLPSASRDALRRYVSNGGVLVLQMPAADPWRWITGLSRVAVSQSRHGIVLRALKDPGFSALDMPQELEVPLASPRVRKGPWSAALFPAPGWDTEVLADYKDTGEPALMRRRLGAGTVYVLGVHLRDLFVRPQAGRAFDAARSEVNGYEPAADIWPLLFRTWYERAEPFWLRLRTTPGRSRGVFLLSHDLGPGADAAQAERFAALESSRGVNATWFIQTSMQTRALGVPSFDAFRQRFIRELASAGHEIGSLSVSFPPDFESLPQGDEVPAVPAYRPQWDIRRFTRGASLLGELGVSKALLEQLLAPEEVRGFRSPAFAYPPALDWSLTRAGYSYDSSLPANAVMTHWPFRLISWKAMARETEIVEFPVTFARPRLDAPPTTASELLELTRLIFRHGGWSCWSLTPDGAPGRVESLGEVLAGLPPETEVMTMGRAARFWMARSRARFSFAPGKNAQEWVLSLDLPEGSPALSFAAARPLASCASSTPEVKTSCSEDILVVNAPSACRAQVLLRLRD